MNYFEAGIIPKTDNIDEMISIGKELEQQKHEIYDDRRRAMLNRIISLELPNATAEERIRLYYQSLYDYWVFGANLKEFFCLHFDRRTYEDKENFITMRNRSIYYQYLNDVKWGGYNLTNKYNCYSMFKEYYKRDAVLVRSIDDYAAFVKFVKQHPTFVVKPTSLAFGQGIHVMTVDGDEQKIREAFNSILGEGIVNKQKYLIKYEINTFILEELIVQGYELAMLHPASINCVRLNTLVVGDEVYFPYPTIKIGRKGNFISNAGDDGVIVGINENGICDTDAFDEYAHQYDVHPETGIRFKGYKIPKWSELLQLGKMLAKQLSPKIRFVGWDMAYTPDGWSILEANPDGEMILSEMAYQKGIKKDIEELIGWSPEKEYWWQEKIQYYHDMQ